MRKTDWASLKGRAVTIWPDADEAGTRYAADAADELRQAGAKSVAIVNLLPGLPEGWDLADPLPDGMNVEWLVNEAKPTVPDDEGPLLYDHTERQSAGALKSIGDFAAKAAEHAARIAAVLMLVDWYVAKALRLHAGARMDSRLLRAQDLLEGMREQPGDVVFRDIMRLDPNHLRTKSEAEAAVKTLLDHRWLVEISARPRRFKVVRPGGE